jgi:hypothetical protein
VTVGLVCGAFFVGFVIGWKLCLIGCRNALRTHGIRKRNGDPF